MQIMAGAPHGGAESAFEDICLALSASGIHQQIILRDNNPERIQKFRDAGVDVRTLPFGGLLDFYTPWKIRKLIADFNPQIVQTWMSRATQKTPSSSSGTYLKVARLGGYYGLKYYRGTDYFIANIADIQNYLIHKGIDQQRVTTIHNFATEENPKTHFSKSDFKTPETATVLLSMARYHPVKALDILIKAAAQIENIHVWLAGEGSQENELKKLAVDLGVSDRVHFLGWQSDRAALYQAADICVFPSRYEPFGNVVVQAWAQKIPLICSRSQGPLQYVHDGEDAVMFDVDDVSQLVESIKKMISDKDLATRLVAAGYARYQNEFSKEKIVKEYRDFYQRIIKENLKVSS